MTQEAYDKQCALLFDKARKVNVILAFNPKMFDCNRLKSLWYGGNIATMIYNDTIVELSAYGDVRAILYETSETEAQNELCCVKDKNNCGRFYDEMSSYIRNDDELQAAINNGRLVLNDSNWFEYDGNVNEKFIDLGMIVDNVLDDSILVAIEQILDSISDIFVEIKACAMVS